MKTRLSLAAVLKTLIVVFWGLMLFFLIQRVYLTPKIVLEETAQLKDSLTWMSVFFKGQKVGYSVQGLTAVEAGYVVDQKTYLRLNLMGQVQELRTVTSAQLNKAMGLRSFNFFMSAGPIRYQLSGTLKGLTLELTGMTAGYKEKTSLQLQEVPRLATGLMPYLTQQGLKKGQRFQVPVFDPSTLSSRPVQVVIEDLEKIMHDGKEIDTYRVRQESFGNQSYAWIDTEGRTVKEEGFLGLSLVRTTQEEATQGIAGRAELADLVEATSAPTNRTIDRPGDVRFLRVRLKGLDLTGFELDGGRQVLQGDILEITREKIDVRDELSLPLNSPELKEYLEPEQFIQSRHPKITARARALAGGVKSPLSIIDKVNGWVFETLEKRPTMSVPSALEVLDTKVGDCNEHAVLATALLRAAGVPTRMAVGVLYFEGRFYYHAWLEAYWGRWTAVDPLLGQMPADAAHIRFLTGGLSRQADMVRVIGRLEVEIMDVQ